MVELQKKYKIGVRRFGFINWVGFKSLWLKECKRFVVVWAQTLLWIAFFGAPLLTASAVVEAVLRMLNPQQWLLRNLQDHVVIFGSGELTISYLRLLRRENRNCRVIVVDTEFESIREQELQQKYGVATVVGDLTLGFLRKQLKLKRAKRVLLNSEFVTDWRDMKTEVLGPRVDARCLHRP